MAEHTGSTLICRNYLGVPEGFYKINTVVICIILLKCSPALAQPDLKEWPIQLRMVDVAAPAIVAATKDCINLDEKKFSFKKGQVYIVHFWTFGCINCQNNLPIYSRWKEKYKLDPVSIVGIHTPETDKEKNPDNVKDAIKNFNITYPVVIDGQNVNWQRWQQQWWPTVYLIDKRGHVRFYWMGELEWKSAGGTKIMEDLIDKLLKERHPENIQKP